MKTIVPAVGKLAAALFLIAYPATLDAQTVAFETVLLDPFLSSRIGSASGSLDTQTKKLNVDVQEQVQVAPDQLDVRLSIGGTKPLTVDLLHAGFGVWSGCATACC